MAEKETLRRNLSMPASSTEQTQSRLTTHIWRRVSIHEQLRILRKRDRLLWVEPQNPIPQASTLGLAPLTFLELNLAPSLSSHFSVFVPKQLPNSGCYPCFLYPKYYISKEGFSLNTQGWLIPFTWQTWYKSFHRWSRCSCAFEA